MANRSGNIGFRQLNVRTWLQLNGSTPANKAQYFNTGQIRAGSLTAPSEGSNQIVRPSNERYGEFEVIGRTKSAPDLGTVTIMQDVDPKQQNALEEIQEDKILTTIHLLHGEDGASVKSPHGWQSKWVIPNADMNSFSLDGDFQSADSDDPNVWSAEFAFSVFNRAIKVAWSSILGSTIATPVTGVAFGITRQKQYFIVAGDGSATEPLFYHTNNGGDTWTATDLASLLGVSEHPNALLYIGDYLISPTEADSYVYASIDDLSASGWAEVTSGFTSTKTPNDVYASDLANILMCADGGYIYRVENIGNAPITLQDGTITTSNLNAIDGYGDTVVIVGAANVHLVSTNGGDTWTSITGPIAATVLNTVSVIDEDTWVVGAADGNAYYTVDGGATWGTLAFQGSGAGSVTKVKFSKVNPSFGQLAHQDGSSVAHMYRTTDGGNKWERVTQTNFPTSEAVNDIAMYDANTVMACGIATGSSDGFIAVAKGSRISDN